MPSGGSRRFQFPQRFLEVGLDVIGGLFHGEARAAFVDELRIGPYRIGHHEHHFRPIGTDQTEIHDRVTYVLPFGPLGNLLHPFLVKPQLSKIFAYREKVERELFG